MTRHYWYLFGPLFCALAGCSFFPHLNSAQNEKIDKAPLPIAGVPSKYAMRVSQFHFLSDVELRRDAPLFKDLAYHREHVCRELRLPPTNTEVFVYLFENKERFDEFLHKNHPKLPERRAFFVSQAMRKGGTQDLMVYTYWGENIQQDLRHELTHAILHSVLKGVPIWLDEGIAEFFELPTVQDGLNPKHLDQVRQASVRFDLDRLERLEEIHQMSPAEYRESWAWVHLMLRSSPQAKQALLSYLQDLRTNPNPGPLRPRLASAFLSLDGAMQTHLTDLDRKLAKNTSAKR